MLVSEEIGPAAMGGNPRAIVIPRWVMALDDSLRSLVIRHEREHPARQDDGAGGSAAGRRTQCLGDQHRRAVDHLRRKPQA